MRVISADIGGTKALFRSSKISGDTVILEREERYDSNDFPSVLAMLSDFEQAVAEPATSICLAVAGPVEDGKAVLTNLAWEISEAAVAASTGIPHVRLVNDFWAVARGVPLLTPEQIEVIQPGERDLLDPIGILGAGTGLGQAILLPDGDGWRIVPSEGGHCDFAPIGEEQRELHAWLEERFGHVSYERLVSGQGISNIYDFLSGADPDHPEMLDAARVAELAAGGDEVAERALELFVDVLAAEAGNLALKVLARGGIFIAGGIAPRHLHRFTSGRFVEVFRAKGRFEPVMAQMPVYVIRDPRVGLIGATAAAAQMARRG